MSKWKAVQPDALAEPIKRTYAQQGRTAVEVLTKDVTCSWDGRVRTAYRVTSNTGLTVDWMPCSRALMSWDPKLVKK